MRRVCFINVTICGSYLKRKLKILSAIACLTDINTVNLYFCCLLDCFTCIKQWKYSALFIFFSYYKNQESRNLFSSLAPFILSQDHDLGNPLSWLNPVQSSLQKASAIRATQGMFCLKIKTIKFQTARTETQSIIDSDL